VRPGAIPAQRRSQASKTLVVRDPAGAAARRAAAAASAPAARGVRRWLVVAGFGLRRIPERLPWTNWSAPQWLGRTVFTARAIAVGLVLCFAAVTLPRHWEPTLRQALTVDDGAPSREATQWFLQRYQPGQIVLTDDNIWTDLVVAGVNPAPVWFYKLDLDPAVREAAAPHGWTDVDYVILGPLADSTTDTLPTVAQAIAHSVVVASFGNGEIMVRKVILPPCGPGAVPGTRCETTPAVTAK
jgi:hypothetical protein